MEYSVECARECVLRARVGNLWGCDAAIVCLPAVNFIQMGAQMLPRRTYALNHHAMTRQRIICPTLLMR